MRYSDLKVGDVVTRDGKPLFVVLECSRESNAFRWMSLQKKDAGLVRSPDLELAGIWDFPVDQGVSRVLRGGEYA